MKRRKPKDGKTGTIAVEEAANLLRRVPSRAWLIYLIMTGGFLLAALYYLAELSSGFNTTTDAAGGAALLALLFCATKVGQCYFMNRLQAVLTEKEDPPWTVRRIGRTFLQQSARQPWGFPSLLVTGLMLVPFPFALAFFESHTLYANGLRTSKEAGKLAGNAARNWPAQNGTGVLILTLFGLVLLANIIAAANFLPGLLRSVFGYELSIAQAGYNFMNTTFIGVFIAVLYLILDPLNKAFYVVRAYHAESRSTGADLRAFLSRATAGALLSVLLTCLATSSLTAAEPEEQVVTSGEVDEAIEQVLDREEYRWRMPRPEEAMAAGQEGSGILDFFESFGQWVNEITSEIGRWFVEIGRFIGNLFPDDSTPPNMSDLDFGWLGTVRILLFILLGAAILILIAMLVRQWKRRRKPKKVEATPETPPVIPDLTEETTQADALPEDGWLALAHEMMQKGEWRLATRALYLAALAHLAAQEWIRIGKAKTNRQYLQELHRRARGKTALHQEFAGRIRTFEQVWYGTHPADAGFVNEFEQAIQHLRQSHAER